MDKPTILVAVGGTPEDDTAAAEQLRRICTEIGEHGFTPRRVRRADDALSVVQSEVGTAAVVLDWTLPADREDEPVPDGAAAQTVLARLRERFTGLPVFLIVADGDFDSVPLWVSEVVIGYVWLHEDTPAFLAGRITRAAQEYQEKILPPLFRALRGFDDSHEYSWHTPAHAGGVAFLKSPVGRAYFDYYGEQLFRSDLTCAVDGLGSAWEHTGPIGDSERNAARVFGAERTFYIVQGTSNANRTVGHHCVVHDEIALLDRNCHKSVHHAMTLAGGRPVYVSGTRNGYGLMGPVPPGQLTSDAVRSAVAASRLAQDAASDGPVYAAITSSTYDGLCYHAPRVAELLGESVPRLHYDEAWSAYHRFHPLYRDRYAMSVGQDTDPATDPDGRHPSVFATQSTHKLLAAISQSSMVHIRSSSRAPVDYHRFNQTFMMHGTTSPLYPMLASLDVATGMMDGPAGRSLIEESIVEAVRFRQGVPRLARRIRESGDRPPWFFGIWQPPTVTDPATGHAVPLEDAPLDLLVSEPGCWELKPGQDWHSYPGLEPGYCIVDPVKVTLTCPGVRADGTTEDWGIPGKILNAYLYERRCIVDKYDPYSVIFFFSMGITKGKWGTLIDTLMDFKAFYDNGAPLADVLPETVAAHPERYGDLTLPDLCAQMHEHISVLVSLLREVSDRPPEPVLPPVAAYEALLRARTEPVKVADLPGRTAAVMVTTTPPGSPILVPGEQIGCGNDDPLVRYLTALETFDRRFPGFESETHGIEHDPEGNYWLECLKPA